MLYFKKAFMQNSKAGSLFIRKSLAPTALSLKRFRSYYSSSTSYYFKNDFINIYVPCQGEVVLPPLIIGYILISFPCCYFSYTDTSIPPGDIGATLIPPAAAPGIEIIGVIPSESSLNTGAELPEIALLTAFEELFFLDSS